MSGTMRNNLFKYWASCLNFYRKQPADHLMQYFGVKNTFYFIWLEHYTLWLIPPSIIAVVSIVILVLFFIPNSNSLHDICGGVIKEPMCPLCDLTCDFWKLTDFCWKARLLTVFDSENAIIFAIVMSIWSSVYQGSWKRRSADIALRWDLTNFDIMDETPRPEYAAVLSKYANRGNIKRQINLITNEKEPKVDYWRYIFPAKTLSMTAMLLLVSMQLTVVITVIMYHTVALTALNTGFIENIITAVLNLIIILIFSPMYRKLALHLTKFEWHRTQPEFEKALVIKLYLLEFLNNYSSVFYIAFVKAKFVGPPNKYFRIFGYREEPCTMDSCMLELTGQLAVIMIGKRVLLSFNKILLPFVTQKYRRLRSFAGLREYKNLNQYEKDFFLQEPDDVTRYFDKLDMAIQYGFVTIFVSAFPLAPLFALINNIFEIRIDAQKLLIYNRRSPMRRCRDIGVWMDILQYISTFSVFTNGFIIAFTSNFVPKWVYLMTKSEDFTLSGYVNFSLSYVAIEDLDTYVFPISAVNATYCRYSAFREPPWSENKYEYTNEFWIVFACRCTFFILFENFILLLMFIIKFSIPDVPQNVKWKMRRNHCMVKEITIGYETSSQKNRGWLATMATELPIVV